MERDWEHFALESQAAVDSLVAETNFQPIEPLTTEFISSSEDAFDYSVENKTSQTQVRIGQRFFRRAVISAYQGRCCITGLAEVKLLVASHIVPWRTDKNNRLNPRNGLCFSVLHDKAFDQGLFTLTQDFKIKNSRKLNLMADNPFTTEWLVKLKGRAIELPQKFSPLEEFVDWHKKNIFLDAIA